jgi:hypothetical protein
MALIYGSSLTDPRYANYGGSYLAPMSSQTNPYAANYQGRMTLPSALRPNVRVATSPSQVGKPVGSVLDTSTSSQPVNPPTNQTQQPTGNEQQSVDPYAQVWSYLDQLAGNLPQWEQQLKSDIENIVSAQQQEVETAKQGQLSKFPTYEEQVRQNQATTLRQLAEDINKALQAGQLYLSGRGAGSSSAADMYSFALAQEANKRRAGVLMQTNQLMNELNLKKAEIENQAQQQLNAINTWKAEQMANIARDFQARKEQLAYTQANMSQQEANYWINRLSQLESEAKSWNQAIQNWALNRIAQLDNYKAQLGQLGSFSAPQLTYQELQSIPQYTQIAQETAYPVSPFLRRKAEEFGYQI